MPREVPREVACPGMKITRRVLNTSAAGWRAPPEVSKRPLPRFYVHQGSCAGCNSSNVRNALVHALGGAPAEQVIPNALAQLLVDAPLMRALLEHPRRTHSADLAEWHVVDSTPFASYVLGQLGLLGGLTGHAQRMSGLSRSLKANRYWSNEIRPAKASRPPPKPFLLLQPYYLMPEVLGKELGDTIKDRKATTVVATVDRSAQRLGRQKSFTHVYLHALEIPHVATPELSDWAAVCAPMFREELRQTSRQSPGGGMRRKGNDAALSVQGLSRSLLAPCDSLWNDDGLDNTADLGSSSGGVTDGKGGGSSIDNGSKRSGFLFHGDTHRFDYGVRAAMRDMTPYLAAPTSYSSRMLSRGTIGQDPVLGRGGVLMPSAGQLAYRQTSRNTSAAMLRASVCFAPQGDIMSSRRLYDALAAG